MLSKEEKMEMLNDAKSRCRRKLFQPGQVKHKAVASLDEYISFLDSVQRIFSPFKISFHPTITKINKL